MNNERTIDFLIAELIEKNKELYQWLTGRRRVFWRVRYSDPLCGDARNDDFQVRKDAVCWLEELSSVCQAKLYRVTVRPKAKAKP